VKNVLFIWLSCLILSSGCVFAEHQVNVGVSKIEFKDKERLSWDRRSSRPITSHVFYPTLDRHVEPLMIGPPGGALFSAGDAVWNAKPILNQTLPLIVMSHGTGGSSLQMLWMAETLVKNGYIVVGVNHHGNTAIETKKYAEGYVLWWERSQDLAVVLALLFENKQWSNMIDQQKVGVVGFSLGGYTAISAIGGITDKALFDRFCRSDKRDSTCDAQGEFSEIEKEFAKVKNSDQVKASVEKQSHSFKVDAIKAAFVISPALVQAFTKHSLASISLPTTIVVGSADQVAEPRTNARVAAARIPDANYIEVEKVGHYTFLSECTELGEKILKGLCVDNQGVSRATVHGEVSERAASFFNQVFSL